MQNRIDYIDKTKGALILLVVLGHCIAGENYLKNIIYSFHMPAFFIISGVLLNYSSAHKKSLSIFVVSRVKQLIVPYILFEFLGYIIQCFTKGFYENIIGFIFRIITFQVHTDVDWFLIALFFAEIMFYLVQRNRYISLVTAVVSFIVAYFIPIRFLRWILSGFIYLIIGYTGRVFLEKGRMRFMPVAILCVLLASLFNTRVDINNGIFGNPFFYLLGAVSGTYMVIAFCRLNKPLLNKLNFWGRNSLVVMGTHTLIIWNLWNKIFTESIPSWFGSCVMLLIVLIFEVMLIHIFCKLRAKIEEKTSVNLQ